MGKSSPAHAIDKELRNSDIEYCIDEYVRRREHREILKEKWFEGLTFEEIGSRHHLSVTIIKEIVYGMGDEVLLKASREKGNTDTNLIKRMARFLKSI